MIAMELQISGLHRTILQTLKKLNLHIKYVATRQQNVGLYRACGGEQGVFSLCLRRRDVLHSVGTGPTPEQERH